MRFDKFTTRFQEAFADAQSLAVGADGQFIEPQHLLLALLDQQDGGTAALLGMRCHAVELADLCVHLPASSVAGCLARLLAANLLAGSPAS